MQKSAKINKQSPAEAKRQRASSPVSPPKKGRAKSTVKKALPSSQPPDFSSVAKKRPLFKVESSRKNSPTATVNSKSKEKKVTAQPAFCVESILEPLKPKKTQTSYFFFLNSIYAKTALELKTIYVTEITKAVGKEW